MARSALRAREAASGRRGGGVATSLILDSLGSAASHCRSVKKRRAAYTGPAFRIQRVSDNTQVNINFTSGGVADASAIATFCSGTTGYVCKWFDQNGTYNGASDATSATDGVDWSETSTTHMPRIYASGAVDGVATFGFPCLYSPDTARGMTSATLASYSGAASSVAVVAALGSGTTSASPRVYSRYGASASDVNDNQGFTLARNDTSGVAAQQWAIKRSNGTRASVAADYNQLSQVDAVVNGAGYALAANGANGTGNVTLSAFGATHSSIGYTGAGYQSVAGLYWVDVIEYDGAWNSTQLTAIRADQKLAFGTYTPPTGGLNYVGALLAGEYFDSGSYNLANFTIGAGNMTSNAGAWRSADCFVSGGAMHVRGLKNATTQNNGSINYLREGGYLIFKGASNAGIMRGGVWRWKMQLPGNSLGYAWPAVIWPNQTPLWPTLGEFDAFEHYGSDGVKTATSEYNGHYDTVQGSGRKLHLPSSGNFGIDMTQPHIYAFAWYPGSDSAGTGAFVKLYVDDTLIASSTDVTYIPHGSTAVPMRWILQTECYATTDAAAVSGPVDALVSFVEAYALP